MILPRSVFTRVGGFPIETRVVGSPRVPAPPVLPGIQARDVPGGALLLPGEPLGQEPAAESTSSNYQSLFEQLQDAPSDDLARIIAAVGGPTLVARFGVGSAHHPGGR